jgi:acyl-CoA thioesterase YciA
MIRSMAQAAEYQVALRVVMLPRDTNQYGTIFGGVILSYIDQAGFIEARRVLTGDVVSLLTCTESTGRTSVRVRVRVAAERDSGAAMSTVTEATLTMVAIDAMGQPIPFTSPPSVHHRPIS